MTKETQMAKNNKILEIVVGSHLYGTNTEDSDKDYVGVFIANKEYYLGMKEINEVDNSIVSKYENGKNTKDAIDLKYYEIRQYFKLLYNCNPNILETIFVNNNNNILYKDPNKYWDRIQNNYIYFLDSELIKKKFLGYAFSQKRKMFVKKDNYNILKEAYDILNKSDKKFLVDESNFNIFQFRNNINTEYRIADIFIPRNASIKRAKEILQTRLGRVGNRQELILKYGYDLKFGSHLIRLLYEGLELLETRKLTYPLKQDNLIIDIKKGKYKQNEVIEIAEDLENELNNLKYDKFKGNYNIVNKLLIEILSDKLRINN